jgi:hypothetical protein
MGAAAHLFLHNFNSIAGFALGRNGAEPRETPSPVPLPRCRKATKTENCWMFHKTVAIIPRSAGSGDGFSGLFGIQRIDFKGITKNARKPEASRAVTRTVTATPETVLPGLKSTSVSAKQCQHLGAPR